MVDYVCDNCNKKFDRKSNYETHIKRKNPCAPTKSRLEKIEEENKILNKKIIELEEQMKQLLQKKDKGTL